MFFSYTHTHNLYSVGRDHDPLDPLIFRDTANKDNSNNDDIDNDDDDELPVPLTTNFGHSRTMTPETPTATTYTTTESLLPDPLLHNRIAEWSTKKKFHHTHKIETLHLQNSVETVDANFGNPDVVAKVYIQTIHIRNAKHS